jgi:hypothetical protein
MKTLVLTVLTIIGFVATICHGQIDIKDYIDSSKPLLLLADKDSLMILSTPKKPVTIEDQRIKRLTIWGKGHTDKWKRTPATYIKSDFYLSQDPFHFRYWKSGFVVLEFKDKQGRFRQVIRRIKPNELDFLIK